MSNKTPSITVEIAHFNTKEEEMRVKIVDCPEDRIVHLISELFDAIPTPAFQAACVEILLEKMGGEAESEVGVNAEGDPM